MSSVVFLPDFLTDSYHDRFLTHPYYVIIHKLLQYLTI